MLKTNTDLKRQIELERLHKSPVNRYGGFPQTYIDVINSSQNIRADDLELATEEMLRFLVVELKEKELNNYIKFGNENCKFDKALDFLESKGLLDEFIKTEPEIV